MTVASDNQVCGVAWFKLTKAGCDGRACAVESKRVPGAAGELQEPRGGSGVINIKTTARNGNVVAVMAVAEDSEIVVISQQGKIIRVGTNSIREAGRATQGVRLLRLDEGDKIAAACCIPPEEGEQGTLLQ